MEPLSATYPAPHVAPARGTLRLPRRWLLAAGFAVAALAALPFALIVGAYAGLDVFGLILPGVSVGGVPVGGKTVPQAAAELDRVWNQEYRITAVDAGDAARSWIVVPGEFGLRVDAWGSAVRASAVGRSRGLVEGLNEMVTAYLDGWEVPPVVTFDPAVARQGLEARAGALDVAPLDAGVSLEGGDVVSWPAQPGVKLDVEASLALIAADPASALLAYRFVPFVTTPIQPGVQSSEDAAAQAERLLESTFALRAYDPVTDEWFSWAPGREEITAWLRVSREGGELHVSLDDAALQAHVEGLAASLGPERTFDIEQALRLAAQAVPGEEAPPLRIRYQPSSYVVLPGDNIVSIGFKVGMPYWKLQEANPQIAVRGLTVGEAITVPPKDAMLALPVVPNKRIVISISEQHMWVYEGGDLLSEHVISTGIASSPTLPGLFQVQAHYLNAYASIWDLWMPHFLSIYEAVPGFWNGIHGLPLLSSGVRLWASVLGRPVSYGCIVMDLAAAEQLYNWAQDGVVVEIRR